MASLSAAALPLIRNFDSQNLSNTAWSLARLGVLHKPLLNAIASSSIPTLSYFIIQDLANTAWAYAPLEVLNLPLCNAISASARATLASETGSVSAFRFWIGGSPFFQVCPGPS